MHKSKMQRRQFLVGSAATTTALLASRSTSAAPLKANVHERRVISQHAEHYHGWPTLAKGHSGELLLVCSGGRELHVCPFGRVELMRSHDEGKTWSPPEVVLDGPIDDRDAGVVVTPRGSILITTFTSLAYEPGLRKAIAAPDTWDAVRLAKWKGAHERISEAQREAALGTWMTRSDDGGVSWSGRYDSVVNSPHGPIVTTKGGLLYAGITLWKSDRKVGVAKSKDDGETWDWLSDIPVREGDKQADYHELHMVENVTGQLIVHIRNHNAKNAGETLQCESSDGGKTWTTPHTIGVWGLPSHLLKLRDGRLLMSYGHRRKPFGNQARISDDDGKTWNQPLTISGDGIGGDLGYPSTVELSKGDFLTAWYERLAGSPRAVLRQARWSLETKS